LIPWPRRFVYEDNEGLGQDNRGPEAFRNAITLSLSMRINLGGNPAEPTRGSSAAAAAAVEVAAGFLAEPSHRHLRAALSSWYPWCLWCRLRARARTRRRSWPSSSQTPGLEFWPSPRSGPRGKGIADTLIPHNVDGDEQEAVPAGVCLGERLGLRKVPKACTGTHLRVRCQFVGRAAHKNQLPRGHTQLQEVLHHQAPQLNRRPGHDDPVTGRGEVQREAVASHTAPEPPSRRPAMTAPGRGWRHAHHASFAGIARLQESDLHHAALPGSEPRPSDRSELRAFRAIQPATRAASRTTNVAHRARGSRKSARTIQ